jgi:hypothetical protein
LRNNAENFTTSPFANRRFKPLVGLFLLDRDDDGT